jgi:hypothetical protein
VACELDVNACTLQAVLNLDEVLRDVLAWDMYAVLASEASAGWGRAALHAPLGFPGIEAYVKARECFLRCLMTSSFVVVILETISRN